MEAQSQQSQRVSDSSSSCLIVAQVRLVTLHIHAEMIIHSIDCGLHCIRCKNYCHMISPNIQVLPFRRSLYGTGTRSLYCGKCPPCSVHLQLGLKDKRREIPNACSNTTCCRFSLRLRWLHYLILTGYKSTRCTQEPPFECKKHPQNPRIVSHYTNAHYLLGITASLTRLMQSYR